MELTLNDSCTIISTTSNQLEDWFNGDLSDVQVTIFFNCQQIGIINLPNIPDINLLNFCNVVNSRANYTATLSGIDIVSSNIVSQSANVDNITKVDEENYIIVANTAGNTHEVIYEVLDINGNTYQVTSTATAAPIVIGEECNFTLTNVTVLTSLSCGLNYDSNTNTLDIYREYFLEDCNVPCIECRKYCDGIYTVNIGDEKSCIFMDCSTECKVVDCFFQGEVDILPYYESLKLGSKYLSIGDNSCINCNQLCENYLSLYRILNPSRKVNILEDCGCNNN